MPKRVGILGGTFDPPHIGHLVVGDQVRDRLGLDEVRLVVTSSPWQKTRSRSITAAPRRLELVVAAVAEAPGLVASDIEIELGGSSYTIVTLAALAAREPDVDWRVIVGADAAAGLDTWHRADELRAKHRFVMVNRPGAAPTPPPGWDCELVGIPALDISSTELRRLVAEGRSVRHLVPSGVVQRLEAWGLYRQGS